MLVKAPIPLGCFLGHRSGKLFGIWIPRLICANEKSIISQFVLILALLPMLEEDVKFLASNPTSQSAFPPIHLADYMGHPSYLRVSDGGRLGCRGNGHGLQS